MKLVVNYMVACTIAALAAEALALGSLSLRCFNQGGMDPLRWQGSISRGFGELLEGKYRCDAAQQKQCLRHAGNDLESTSLDGIDRLVD